MLCPQKQGHNCIFHQISCVKSPTEPPIYCVCVPVVFTLMHKTQTQIYFFGETASSVLKKTQCVLAKIGPNSDSASVAGILRSTRVLICSKMNARTEKVTR
jgi:hypothetical protein